MIRVTVLILLASFAIAQDSIQVREIIGAKSTPLRRPTSFAIGMGGLIYVCDTGNNRLVALDSTGKIVLESSKGGSAGELRWPSSVAVGNGERVYVADAGNKRIVEFSRLLEWKGELAIQDDAGVALEPRLLTVDGVGDLFVYESDDGQIIRYDSFYKVVARLGGQSGTTIYAPASLSFSQPLGLVWTDHQSGEVFHCDAYLSEPRKLSGLDDLSEVWQVAAFDSVILMSTDTTLTRRSGTEIETLQFSELGIEFVRGSDLRLGMSSSGPIYILDSRRGTLHSLYWP